MVFDPADARIRLVISTSDKGAIEFEFDASNVESSVISKAKTSASLHEFPRATFDLKLNPSSQSLLSVKRGDRIEAWGARGSDAPRKFFSGDISDIEIQKARDSDAILALTALSPFYRFCFAFVSDDTLTVRNGLRAIFNHLQEYCGVRGSIVVDDGIDDNVSVGFADQIPALMLIRLILVQKDLSLLCPTGDELYVHERSSLIGRMASGTAGFVDLSQVISARLRF